MWASINYFLRTARINIRTVGNVTGEHVKALKARIYMNKTARRKHKCSGGVQRLPKHLNMVKFLQHIFFRHFTSNATGTKHWRLSDLTGWTPALDSGSLTRLGNLLEQLTCCGRGTCHGFQITVGSAATGKKDA